MNSFQNYLDESQEVGFVDAIVGPSLMISGLPGLTSGEVVVFESGALGQVASLLPESANVMLLEGSQVKIGTRVARTNKRLEIPCSEGMLGLTLTPLGLPFDGGAQLQGSMTYRPIDIPPPGIDVRVPIAQPFHTGVGLIDLLVPLALGQRELFLGDNKVGKRNTLLQLAKSHVMQGGVTIFALIAQRRSDIIKLQQYVTQEKLAGGTLVVASAATDPSGLVFTTPYTAMTLAEFFRDQGKDVLVILDDLTIHAKHYREISLTSRRFPGRDSYPGDIFYTHARLLERAGCFSTGSITCIPLANTILGDITGYIQTNLMSMTDGHVFFDTQKANEGYQPAINTFLSVTRVGHQVQKPLYKALSARLTQFLSNHQQLQQLAHFGGEMSVEARFNLELGDNLNELFKQNDNEVIPMPVMAVFVCLLLSGKITTANLEMLRQKLSAFSQTYHAQPKIKQWFDSLVEAHHDPQQLISEAPALAKQLLGLDI
jgi:F-type H+-transporting ATPase subunit alpha